MDVSRYTIRDLQAKDRVDYLHLLGQLTDTSLLSKEKFITLYDAVLQNPFHIIRVIECEKHIIGCGTIIIEQKFTHGGSKVGHIEEIVILEEHRRQGLGTKIIEDLVKIGKKHQVYKVILDCSEDVEKFYERCHFHRASYQMEMRF